MPRFRPHRDGHGNATTFDCQLPKGKLKEAGFLLDDGTLLDFEVHVESNCIVLSKKNVKRCILTMGECNNCADTSGNIPVCQTKTE
jgi:hypothetical protein